MSKQNIKYLLDENRRFVVENYNWAKPFSNFFPGIGGKWGIPLWVYYVNRAQGISSIGIRNKDNAIMEFFSFNKACQQVGTQGFRTFIRVNEKPLYEPFRQTKERGVKQVMTISTEALNINEVNPVLGMEMNVEYFPLVNLPVAGLVRKVSLRNLRKKALKLELLDGLPHILAYGMNQHSIKFIARHIEAMIKVDMMEGTPFYRLKQVPLDTPEVVRIEGGNFYFTFLPDQRHILADSYIVDTESVFGVSGWSDYPWNFAHDGLEGVTTIPQMYENRTPCAFTPLSLEIPKEGEFTFYSFIGNASSENKLQNFKTKVTCEGFIEEKREENSSTIEQIKDNMFTVSSNKNFDGYCGQTFLDNVMRGGLPVVFKAPDNKKVFYLYARKHGDIERDYNHFVVEQTYLSQGNAHFRDVNQNRRNDVWFNPEIEDFNIIMFLNLMQNDGFNPLVVNGLTYTANNVAALRKWLGGMTGDKEGIEELIEMVESPFTPGAFIMKLEDLCPGITASYDEIVATLLSFCRQNDVGEPSEGFWVDHWTYNLDLLENFLMIYPERLRELLMDKHVYTFYDNPDIVKPRSEKFVLIDDRVRQYGAVERDRDKLALVQSRKEDRYKVRTAYGKGKVYTTNLLIKFLSIIANKIASLDPEGIGIEMEADKPGWNDPLNGLPGLVASSLNETIELARTCSFLLDAITKCGIRDDESINLFEDLYIFIMSLIALIETRLFLDNEKSAFIFWEESHKLKEEYRKKTRLQISGKEWEIKVATAKDFLRRCLKLLDMIFTKLPREKVFDDNGVCYTYFLNEVTHYRHLYSDKEEKVVALNPSGYPLVMPEAFSQKPLPLFLEGPVHLLKIKGELAGDIYRGVKASGIYDEQLKMYKTSESIASASYEIGRARAYLPGWIENESVYLHIEYKYLLELLRAGLHEEYYEELRNALIPFLDPETYGRSTMENSSFIVSSVFPNRELHGRGFQPRLTGATAEFLTMWIIMVAGERPFHLDEKQELSLRFKPILPGNLFTEREEKHTTYNGDGERMELVIPADCFAFKFLGKTIVVYHNKKRKNTYGSEGTRIA
ncbi:MAG: hypothetical protein ACE5GF_07355, partial [Thermodesulfobacteriota bacterium]